MVLILPKEAVNLKISCSSKTLASITNPSIIKLTPGCSLQFKSRRYYHTNEQIPVSTFLLPSIDISKLEKKNQPLKLEKIHLEDLEDLHKSLSHLEEVELPDDLPYSTPWWIYVLIIITILSVLAFLWIYLKNYILSLGFFAPLKERLGEPPSDSKTDANPKLPI